MLMRLVNGLDTLALRFCMRTSPLGCCDWAKKFVIAVSQGAKNLAISFISLAVRSV
jgi:hypothetical protein